MFMIRDLVTVLTMSLYLVQQTFYLNYIMFIVCCKSINLLS